MKSVLVGRKVLRMGDTYHWYPQSYEEKKEAEVLASLCQGVQMKDDLLSVTLPRGKESRRAYYLKLRVRYHECAATDVLFAATQSNDIKFIQVHF